MRAFLIALIATGSMASAGTVFADPPPSLDHQRCVAITNAKFKAPEVVALGPLDDVADKLGCAVG